MVRRIPELRRARLVAQAIGETAREARFNKLYRINRIDALRRLLGDTNATFRGTQEEMLEHVIDGKERIIGAMPTSEGKSVLFIIYSSEYNKYHRLINAPSIFASFVRL